MIIQYFNKVTCSTSKDDLSMPRFSFLILYNFTVLLCFTSILQITHATESLEDNKDFPAVGQKKSYVRKSARLAFLEESDDPMFKFLTKILNTAQLRSKNALARAQNSIKKTQELKTEVTDALRKNNYV